ncbi:unnamed protein product [Clonostachys rhizophaga]|uniref:Uncharacterized protein n=1 Tax=Clonostachys rhizophaga TaxID=160324 RepID=A0A9N9V536_9HYPO|nr:unnamed protein product [Clonostachys rhizophaga]
MADFQSGLWWDYSRPAGLQGTITLPMTQGNIFLSFLTIIVAMSGASLWGIAASLLHSFTVRKRRNKVEIFDIQQRVTLINSKSPMTTVIDSIRIYMSWSKHEIPGLGFRTVAIVLPALLFWVGITAASIFTSKVATSGDTGVLGLRRSNFCGIYAFTAVRSSKDKESSRRILIEEMVAARNYADNFYLNSTGSLSRSPYVTTTLPHTESRMSCLLESQDRCALNTSLRLESGLLDSHLMLGINAPPSDRIHFRAGTTCTVVYKAGLDKLSKTGNSRRYFLGGVLGKNHTYKYNRGFRSDDIGYFLSGYDSEWEPPVGLRVNNSDMSIIILSGNNVRYRESIEDPFFWATDYNKNLTAFVSNNDANFMICADQYQFCDPAAHRCSPWSNRTALRDSVITQSSELGFNDAQVATMTRLAWHMDEHRGLETALVVKILNSGALDASSKLMFNDVSLGISTDAQWIVEASRWFQIRLAFLQARVAAYMDVPSARLSQPITSLNDRSWLQEHAGLSHRQVDSLNSQCHTQLVRSSGEIQNFSFTGVLIILLVGTCLTIISYNMTGIMDACGRLLSGSEATNARQGDDKQHLLRMALSASGYPAIGEWKTGFFQVPVTSHREIVTDLEVFERGLTLYPLKEALTNRDSTSTDEAVELREGINPFDKPMQTTEMTPGPSTTIKTLLTV